MMIQQTDHKEEDFVCVWGGGGGGVCVCVCVKSAKFTALSTLNIIIMFISQKSYITQNAS